LHFDVVNQTTGTVSSAGETPYHGSYNILGPIRVSVDGQSVLLGSGDIYSQSQLNWAGSLGSQVSDARWFTNGSLVTLTTSGSQTTLRRLGATSLPVLEQLSYTGQALRVVGSDTRMAVVLSNNNTVKIQTYVPSDDSDGDGVSNTQDAFPLDRAASADTDRDGYPDAWNTGRTAADSTTGLTLDAFPQDSACWLSTHANTAGTCNYGATMPNYTPDQVVQNGDVVYLLSSVNKRVYRWSLSTSAYLNPYVVGINQGFSTLAPSKMAYASNNQRLYLGYSTGAIRYIDTAATSPAEVAFANTALGVNGLASVGNYVLAQDSSGAWATHYIFNASGTVTDSADWNYYSREYAWDPVNSRVYFFRDDTSPNDLHYEVINQSTGEITSGGETPYHGSYNIQTPIRVSVSGQSVLLGSGDIYTQPALTWAGSLGSSITDARWLADGSLVTLTTANNQTTLRRLAATTRTVLEQLTFPGQALRVVGSDTAMAVVVINSGTVQFRSYAPDDDSDDDGVLNTQDAFPLDRAASVDTDRDGYPDAWNAGRSQADSTTGLTLDAFPQDSACYLPSHGSNGVCNNAATVPNYTPDRVVQSGDVVYLLSSANKRVYRWSISGAAYLNPYIVGISQGSDVVAPTQMTFSDSQHRLYLGYDTGAIRYIDVTGSTATEVQFANTAMAVNGLAAVGNYLLAQDYSGAWATHYVFNAAGAITAQNEWNYYSPEYAWDPNTSRVYFFRANMSPGDLHYEVIDQTTGQITSAGETPYHGDYPFGGVIRPTNNGQYVLLGTGDIFAQSTLQWSGSIGGGVADARWMANGSLVTLTTSGNQTLLRRLGSGNLGVLEQVTLAGQALRVVGSDTAMVVLVINSGTVQFVPFVPNDDSDGDGVANTTDAFPLDVAASVDTDRDGYPDAWNAGRSAADSTTGLTLDAFPQDSACWLSAHGSGGVCNYGATIPNYTPEKVVQNGNIVYLLSNANQRVYRWSISAGAYLNPYVVGVNQGFSTVAPVTIEYSVAHHRLYLGYATGAIRYIDVNATSPVETPFATEGSQLAGLTSAGNFLVAHTAGTYGNGATTVLNSSGVTTATGSNSYYYYSGSDHAWDSVNSRLYYVANAGYGANALYYEVIDQTSGAITSSGNSVYDSNSTGQPPARVSVNGQYILIGNGDIYSQNGLTKAGSIGAQVIDARWFANGSVATLTTANNQTALRRLGSTNLAVLEQRTFTGQALRVVGSDTSMAVVLINNGTVQFQSYVPNDDSDGDGVTNTLDAFPLDAAASVDTDRDGYPDSWNAGKTQADSTTGLTLDAFPTESACWLPAHGSGGVCNYGATIPNYTPDLVAQQGNIVYLLSSANRRVYRWSLATGAYLSPYIVGLDLGLSTAAPTAMAYSPNNQRLYLGYGNGAIRYISVSGSSAEVALTTMSGAISSLASAGNSLAVQVGQYTYGGGYVVSSTGVTTDQGGYYYGYSRETAWDPVTSRLYYFRDGISPNTLLYDVIDQTTGEVTSTGEAPYDYTASYFGPVRVSTDGQQVLLGTGDIYARTGLAKTSTLGKTVIDAFWKDNLIVDVDNTDQVEIRDANTRAVLQTYQYLGQPLRVLQGTSEVYLMHVMNGTTSFIRLPFYDGDGDLIARWWEQRYGLSDANAADALTDLDSDGVNNQTEFLNLSNPTLSDTDADGLTDQQEIVTWHTNPGKPDSDGDGLNDYAEVITHHSNPLDTDSDDDGYSDYDEVLYGGDPNDVSGLPHPLTSYTQTFEGTPDLSAWSNSAQSSAPWVIDATTSHAGTASYKSGAVSNSQTSGVKFRGFFRPGQLTFWAKVDPGYCCNRMYVWIDGVQTQYITTGTTWNSYTLQIPLGIHDIEWRFERDYYAGQATDAAWIDDVTFVGQ